MEHVLPKYVRPIAKINDHVTNEKYWHKAVEDFDEKRFKQAVLNVIRYINSNLINEEDFKKDVIEITQMQGSAEIHIKITDTNFSINAPFLRIDEQTNRVALLRRVAEVNFTSLRLEQIHLKNNELHFEYKMPIDLAQPNKLYDIIRNVAVFADKYDDVFVENYNAAFIFKPKYTKLTPGEKDIVWQQISDIFEDYKDYSRYFKEKRLENYIWDLLIISFLKIANMPYVNGKLRTDLDEIIDLMRDWLTDFKYRLDKGANFMKKLMEKPREDIMKNIYHADQLISLRLRSNEQIIADRLKKSLENVKNIEKKGDNLDLSYYLTYLFLMLLYDYNLEESYKKEIYEVLEAVSGVTPKKAAPRLAKVFYKMLNKEINPKPDNNKKKGFFARLFG